MLESDTTSVCVGAVLRPILRTLAIRYASAAAVSHLSIVGSHWQAVVRFAPDIVAAIFEMQVAAATAHRAIATLQREHRRFMRQESHSGERQRRRTHITTHRLDRDAVKQSSNRRRPGRAFAFEHRSTSFYYPPTTHAPKVRGR